MGSCDCDFSDNSRKMENLFRFAISILLFYPAFASTAAATTTATLENSALNETGNGSSNDSSNSVFSRRQGFVGIPHLPPLYAQVPSNLYFGTTPALYQTAVGTNSPNRAVIQAGTPAVPQKKGSGAKEEGVESRTEEEEERPKSKKKKGSKKDKRKNQKEEDAVESKTTSGSDDGSGRGCPACISGTCDPFLDPSTNISGIPVIQIIIACAIGAFWAGIFIFFLVNFIEHDKNDGGGYGGGYGTAPAPQYGSPPSYSYGAPVSSQYGAPSSSYSSYNTNRIANRYGRASPGLTFDEVSSWVWNAVEKLANLYDEESNDKP